MKLKATLDETDEKIIALLCQGFSPKEIAHKIWKSSNSVRCRLKNLRKHYNCATTIELIAKMLTKDVA